jgi:hypothetical protein
MTEPTPQASLFMRKPKIQPGYKLSHENVDYVADWCRGTIFEGGTNQVFVRVATSNPICEAKLGDWIVKVGRKFAIYSQRYVDTEFVIIPNEDTDLGNAVQMSTRVVNEQAPPAAIPTQVEHHCCQHSHAPTNVQNAPAPKKFNRQNRRPR